MQTPYLIGFITATILLPLAAFSLLGLLLVLGFTPTERKVAWLIRGSIFGSLLSLLPVAYTFAESGFRSRFIPAGELFALPGYRFALGFILDTPSLSMAALTLTLAAFVARFSQSYMHQERGFSRYFALIALFTGAMLLTVFAATYDQLFIGWELVGLTSAFLIAFFHQRTGPARAGLRVFITYRISDIGLLLSAAGMHHHLAINHIPLPGELSETVVHNLSPSVLTLLALGIAIAAMGKAAQLPLGGWLPRAMEGPTPSSAIFYGGLSVHAGIYLLIRSYPIFERAPIVQGVLIATGAATFIYASIVVRTQTDAKSSLAHATMAQLGLMVVFVGFGLTRIALVHLCAHAIVRTWQLLRAPNIFREATDIHAALSATGPAPVLSRPARSLFLYRAALARFSIDSLTERYLLYPLIALGRLLENFERRLDARLCGFSEPLPVAEAPPDEAYESAEVPELTKAKPAPKNAEHRP